MRDAYTLAVERPWLLTPEALETLLTVAARLGDPEALAARLGRPLENSHTVTIREGGVAVIPVRGPLFRHANLLTDISGATATEVLATDLQTALEDPAVRAIVLDIASPGGEAAGIHELANRLAVARARKPVVAYVGDQAASGAYWLAAAAGEIVLDATARVGSIGVVMAYRDRQEQEAKAGIRTHEIVSSQSPLKRASPATAEGRAEIQRLVDELATIFIQAVATFRAVSPATVMAEFGRGGQRLGQDAVRVHMADRLGDLETVIAELAGRASARQRGFPLMSATEMTPTPLPAAEAPVPERPPLPTPPVPDAKPADTPAVDFEAIRAEAVAGERARIQAILALKAPGFETELAAAIQDGLSPEATALRLWAAAAERGITLAAIAADATRAPHAPTPRGEAGHRTAVISAIVAGARR